MFEHNLFVTGNKTICSRLFFSIFCVLSTVITDADCCSSRIIFFSESVKEQKNFVIDSLPPYHSLSSIQMNNNNCSNINKNDDSNYKLKKYENHKKQQQQQDIRQLINVHDDFNIIELIISTECSPLFKTYYCLHGGRCFNYTIANFTSPSCECLEGFFGERCEAKYVIIESDFSNQNISTAKIYLSSFIAGCFGTFAIYISYKFFCK